MEIFVEGVRITLTAEQVALVEKEQRRRQRCGNSFAKMLKHFGFKRVKSLPNCWEHISRGWFAEILDRGNYSDVWMVGKELKCSGFPGGYCYGEPEDVEAELLSALEKLN